MQIFAKTWYDKTLTLNVKLSDTIYDVKLMIQDKGGTPTVDHQRLVYAGKVLQNEFSLFDYNINSLSTLELWEIGASSLPGGGGGGDTSQELLDLDGNDPESFVVQSDILQLEGLGFGREKCINALSIYPAVGDAANYLFEFCNSDGNDAAMDGDIEMLDCDFEEMLDCDFDDGSTKLARFAASLLSCFEAQQHFTIEEEQLESVQRDLLNEVDGGEDNMNEVINNLTRSPFQASVQQVGLENTGNSCYFNSAAQSFCHLPIISDYLLSGAYQRDLRSNLQHRLAVALSSLSRQLSSTHCDVICPNHAHRALQNIDSRYDNPDQQDVAECAGVLIDRVLEETNSSEINNVEQPEQEVGESHEAYRVRCWDQYREILNTSPLVDLMSLQQSSTRISTCPCCNRTSRSVTFHPYPYIQLPIPTTVHGEPVSRCTLNDCFEEYLKEEAIDDFTCEHEECNKMVCKSSKKLEFHNRPPILMITPMKYFYKVDEDTGAHVKEKINVTVDFQLDNIDLSSFLSGDGDGTYVLYSTNDQVGGLDGGHYTATVRDFGTNTFHHFNDTQHKIIRHEHVVKESNYNLWLVRRDIAEQLRHTTNVPRIVSDMDTSSSESELVFGSSCSRQDETDSDSGMQIEGESVSQMEEESLTEEMECTDMPTHLCWGTGQTPARAVPIRPSPDTTAALKTLPMPILQPFTSHTEVLNGMMLASGTHSVGKHIINAQKKTPLEKLGMSFLDLVLMCKTLEEFVERFGGWRIKLATHINAKLHDLDDSFAQLGPDPSILINQFMILMQYSTHNCAAAAPEIRDVFDQVLGRGFDGMLGNLTYEKNGCVKEALVGLWTKCVRDISRRLLGHVGNIPDRRANAIVVDGLPISYRPPPPELKSSKERKQYLDNQIKARYVTTELNLQSTHSLTLILIIHSCCILSFITSLERLNEKLETLLFVSAENIFGLAYCSYLINNKPMIIQPMAPRIKQLFVPEVQSLVMNMKESLPHTQNIKCGYFKEYPDETLIEYDRIVLSCSVLR